jgi:hypothetical protein
LTGKRGVEKKKIGKRKDRKEGYDEEKGVRGVVLEAGICGRLERQVGWMDEKQEGRDCREKVEQKRGRAGTIRILTVNLY